MRPAEKGRSCLKGHWKSAVGVEWICLAAHIALLAMEWAGFLWIAGGLQRVIHAQDWQNPAWWGPIAVVCGAVLVDFLLLSPLYAGRNAFYWELARRQRQEQQNTCTFSIRPEDAQPKDRRSENFPETREFDAIRETDAAKTLVIPIPLHGTLARYFGRGYGRALGWRAGIWGRFWLSGAVASLPAALLWGYGERIAVAGSGTPIEEILGLFCGLFGLFALLAGWVLQQMFMLRYLPAGYLLAQGHPIRGLFRDARRRMKGKIWRTAEWHIGFSGWFASCVLVIPWFYVAPLFQTTRAAMVLPLAERPLTEKKPRRMVRRSRKRAPSAG